MNKAEGYDFSVSNEELLDMCKRQDQEALRLLLRRHERPVYNLLYRMLSNHEDAEESLAEVFVKVWRGAPFFKGDSKFTTWLYRIATNTARDVLRSRRSRCEVPFDDVIENELESRESATGSMRDPAEQLIETDGQMRILRGMQMLSEEDRQLISLYHFQDCNYEQVSKITGTPVNNLKVKLFRARRRLRKACDALEEGDDGGLRTSTTESAGLRKKATDCS